MICISFFVIEGTDPKDLPLPEDVKLPTRKSNLVNVLMEKRHSPDSLEMNKFVLWRKVDCSNPHYICTWLGIQLCIFCFEGKC